VALVLKVLVVRKVHKDHRVWLVQQVHLAVHKVHLVRQVLLVLKDQQVQLVHKDRRVFVVLLVHLAHKV
jgi:hypothetical protein